MAFKHVRGPVCGKCQQTMTWTSEQIVGNKPMQVFHCETCDKYAAALPGINGVKARAGGAVGAGL